MHQHKAGVRLPHQYGSLTEIKHACNQCGQRNNVDMLVSKHRLERAYYTASTQPVTDNRSLRPR